MNAPIRHPLPGAPRPLKPTLKDALAQVTVVDGYISELKRGMVDFISQWYEGTTKKGSAAETEEYVRFQKDLAALHHMRELAIKQLITHAGETPKP